VYFLAIDNKKKKYNGHNLHSKTLCFTLRSQMFLVDILQCLNNDEVKLGKCELYLHSLFVCHTRARELFS
jgi:hypothetical protein